MRNKIILTVSGNNRDEIYEKSIEVVAKYTGASSIAEAKTLITGIEIETQRDGEIFTAEVWINLK